MSSATRWNMSLVFNWDASLVLGHVALVQGREDVRRQSGWLKWSDHIEADTIIAFSLDAEHAKSRESLGPLACLSRRQAQCSNQRS